MYYKERTEFDPLSVVLIEILKILWAEPVILIFFTHGHFESYRGPFR